jgi:NAD/NADP transhydrogenase beta subunit
MIAFGKLDGRIGDIKHPALRIVNLTFLVVLLVALVFILFMKPEAGNNLPIYLFAAAALI